jgi:hypothetical protein
MCVFSYHSSWSTLCSCKKWIRANGIVTRTFMLLTKGTLKKNLVLWSNEYAWLSPWNRIFLEISRRASQGVSHLLWNIDVHYVFTRARHWSLSRTSWIQSTLYLSVCLSIYLSTYLFQFFISVLSVFQEVSFLCFPHFSHAYPISSFIIFKEDNLFIFWEYYFNFLEFTGLILLTWWKTEWLNESKL